MSKEFVEIISKNKLEIILALAGISLIIGAIFAFASNSLKQSSGDIEIIPASGSAQVESSKITVDVSGAVANPGVYLLSPNSRVGEAIQVAGGLDSNADNGWISKNLNLAAKLADGAKIYIPQAGEVKSETTVSNSTSQVTASTKVNINTSGTAELEALPAIGPVTAGKIISNRPYLQIEELLTKKVVGKATFDKIKDQISTY